MQRAKVGRRVGLGILILLVLVVGVLGVAGTGVLRQSWPQVSGEIELNGLGAKVTVIRDAQGVPQIYADSADDLFRAQGFVAAQDRFFEMDFRRHVTAGRLSELVGAGGVQTDKVIRTLGWRKVAEQELPLLAPATRQYLDAYAVGVNDYITRSGEPSNMALEYAVLGQQVGGYRVEKWSALDSLSWLKAMAWDLRADYDDELARARLGTSYSPEQLKVIFPDFATAGHQPILSPEDWMPATQPQLSGVPAGLAAPARSAGPTPQTSKPSATSPPAARSASVDALLGSVKAALDAVPVTMGRGDGIGSNSWVVAGSRTTTGKPLLANDPHLGTSIPGIWYQTGLHCRTVNAACPFDVAGFSFSGLPGIVIGHNAKVSWGFTNLGPDVSDFYLEKVTGSTYLRDGKDVPLTVSTETIKVAGGNDVTLPVLATVHGPILSGVVDSIGAVGRNALVRLTPQQDTYAVSLAWTGLVPSTTADAVFELDAAQDFTQFRAAAKKFVVPAQNLVYADTEGHIGYQAPGLIPVRATSVPNAPAGYWPAPGWDSQYDWKGYVPFDALPWTEDPKEGFIVTANQQVTAAPSAPFLTSEWDYGYRSDRIREMIQATPKISPEQMGTMQLDTRNGFAPVLVRALLEVNLAGDPADGIGLDEFTQQAQSLLGDWDFTQPADKSKASVRAAFFNAVYLRLLEYTFNDELPNDVQADGGARWMVAMTQLLKEPKNAWWDDRRTPGVIESRDEILRKALVRARLDLAEHLGKEPVTWSWGKLHTVTFTHPVLGGKSVPGIVSSIFNRGPIGLPGGPSIVDANGWDASKGNFDVRTAPSMRMVVDLADLDASRWVNQTGNSGHPYEPHYIDQADAWAGGESYPWPSTRAAVEKAKSEELVLTPRAGS